MAAIIKKCETIPGYELFKYYAQEEQLHVISSNDVNDYLNEITSENITAKDFRTWSGTVLFLEYFTKHPHKTLPEIIKDVAGELGNTPTICKKSYIHPKFIELIQDERILKELTGRNEKAQKYFSQNEKIALHLLKKIRKNTRLL